MSELRQNILTGNWAVIAPERGEKPVHFKKGAKTDIRDLPPHDPSCPFCPGNEERFEIDAVDIMTNADGDWITKTIENKYKIFADLESCPAVPEKFSRHGIYSYYHGCGDHRLVVENRIHNKVLGLMSDEEIFNVFLSYRKEANEMKKNPNNFIAIIFKNQGETAGGSQPHAHSQIVGSRIVPAWIRNALHEQERYFDRLGCCAMCALIEYELDCGERIVAETDDVVVLSPYAAGSPYEMWVIPKRHFACYTGISDDEIKGVSTAVKSVLNSYVQKLNNSDFNYFVHSSPYPLANVPYYHSYVQIVPRSKHIGGFEKGTQIPVNPTLPEVAAALFRES